MGDIITGRYIHIGNSLSILENSSETVNVHRFSGSFTVSIADENIASVEISDGLYNDGHAAIRIDGKRAVKTLLVVSDKAGNTAQLAITVQ